MAIEVDTKDCTALGDAEMEEMADLTADGPNQLDVGVINKQAEEWVLVAQARENGKLRGFAFCTLERIGGTPSVLVGVGSVQRVSSRDATLRALVTDLLRRAVLAFPDEDVLVGTRLNDASGFDAYKTLNDVVPRPGHKASGEERAWGRRLAKRFGLSATAYDDRAFRATGNGEVPCVFDHECTKPDKIDAEVAGLFDDIDAGSGDVLIAFGWAMAEELEKLS